MTDVFISYTRDERSRCSTIAERLRALGLDVWFDAKLASGTSFDREIEERVRSAKAVLVLWSPKSVQSNWVRNEATIGQQRDVLVSVEIVPTTLPIAFTNTHTEFLHDANFSDDDPAWINILARMAYLTEHPSLAKYRELEPRATRRKKRLPVAGALVALVAITGVAVSGWWLLNRVPTPAPSEEVSLTIAPEVDQMARLIVGQWALRQSDCPPRTPGQPVDMTPSNGPWFTMQYEDGTLRATSAGATVLEQIVGVQNGWLRTTTAGDDLFYRVDESGRLLLRVGNGEPTRLEPCI